MNAEEFLPIEKYKEIISHVEQQDPFEYEKNIKGYEVRIHSSKWNTYEKQGIYMVSVGSMGKTSGCGGGNDVDEFLKDWSTYEKALKIIDGLMKCMGLEVKDEPHQLSILEMG